MLQGVSGAGRGWGLSDPRSALLGHIFRVFDEMQGFRPQFPHSILQWLGETGLTRSSTWRTSKHYWRLTSEASSCTFVRTPVADHSLPHGIFFDPGDSGSFVMRSALIGASNFVGPPLSCATWDWRLYRLVCKFTSLLCRSAFASVGVSESSWWPVVPDLQLIRPVLSKGQTLSDNFV